MEIDTRQILSCLADNLEVQIKIGGESAIRSDWEGSPPYIDSLMDELERYRSQLSTIEKRNSFSVEEELTSPEYKIELTPGV